MKRVRTFVFTLISALVMALILLTMQVPQELRSLSRAKSDNAQWTILQVDTEIANFSAALARARLLDTPDFTAVALRAEILLSRIALVQNASGQVLFADHRDAGVLLAALDGYSVEVGAILDQPGPLTVADLLRLDTATLEHQPDVRRLAVLGLTQGAVQSDLQRERLSWLLGSIALAAAALIVVLAASGVVFDRLLGRLRRQESAAKATSDQLAATVKASLDGIVIANEAGEIIAYNAAAEQVFGWTAAEIVGRMMSDTIIPQKHRAAHDAGMTRYLKTGESRAIDAGRIELTALRKTGEDFPIELNITTAVQDSGKIFIAYVRDISERKIAEQRLIEARDQAEQMDRAKSQLLKVMSHEMRTPLNGILGVLDLLRTKALTAEQDHYIEIATASGEVLLEQVNEALDATRLETNDLVLSQRPFDLEELVKALTGVLQPLAGEKGLALVWDINPSMRRAFVSDPGRIRQILTNLIGNAIKFTASGRITVSVTGIHAGSATTATIQVADTGPGILPEDLDKIFEDFVALRPPSGRLGRSDGLGLAISRRIARRLGGDLTAQSDVKKGSTFSLVLPLQRAAADSEAPSSETEVFSPKTVLIVEDNPINRSVLRDMLANLGHRVFEAEDGEQALAATADRLFDLIVMDISMPGIDGIEAAKAIRQSDGPNRATYVLGVTAHGEEEYRATALDAGMDSFYTKPIRLAALRDTLEGVTAARPGSIPVDGLDTLIFDELVTALGIDKARETVTRFFVELGDSRKQLEYVLESKDAKAVAHLLHHLRGGANLLGLTSLVTLVDRAALSNEASDSVGLRSVLKDLQSEALSLEEALVRRLDDPPSV